MKKPGGTCSFGLFIRRPISLRTHPSGFQIASAGFPVPFPLAAGECKIIPTGCPLACPSLLHEAKSPPEDRYRRRTLMDEFGRIQIAGALLLILCSAVGALALRHSYSAVTSNANALLASHLERLARLRDW